MKPFQAPLDDILFSLTHVAEAAALESFDAEFTAEIGGHFAAFAEGEIAPIDEIGDAEGCRLENGRVRMPSGFKACYDAYAEQGWGGLTVPEEYGGQGMGALTLAVTSEIFSGANHSLQMVTGLVPGAVRVLTRFGTEDQRARYMPMLASGEMLPTMCLTEPGAGSDLARVRCRANAADGGWRITGEKIFISGGDQDMTPHILHLVLARTSDNGIKGLSLFLCPSERSDGARNAVSVTRIEEKMGLHASPTCQLAFDGAEAELVGEEGQGLLAMFAMMNHARVDVALQGVAHAARAYDIAASYAAERVQGRGADGAAVTLDSHADVRRMLDEIDAKAMVGRGIAHIACVAMEAGDAPDLVEFLTPLAKAYCSEGGMRAAELGVQVLGGYGYLREYRIEQTYRDARITAIYEGTNGIHAKMMATRLAQGKPAEAFGAFLDAEAARWGQPKLVEAAKAWHAALQSVRAAEDATLVAKAFFEASAAAMEACVWARIAAAAPHHPEPARLERLSAARLAS